MKLKNYFPLAFTFFIKRGLNRVELSEIKVNMAGVSLLLPSSSNETRLRTCNNNAILNAHLFLARHTYSPSCSFDVGEILSDETTTSPFLKTSSTSPSNTTGWPFLNHLIFGVGSPEALHLRVISLPIGTRTEDGGEILITGGNPEKK